MTELIGETKDKYTLSNPHPLHGKDPNIMNEYGHTHYPKFLHKFHPEKGHIMRIGDKHNDPHDSVIVSDEDEEAEAIEKGYSALWVKPTAWAKPSKSAKVIDAK